MEGIEELSTSIIRRHSLTVVTWNFPSAFAGEGLLVSHATGSSARQLLCAHNQL